MSDTTDIIGQISEYALSFINGITGLDVQEFSMDGFASAYDSASDSTKQKVVGVPTAVVAGLMIMPVFNMLAGRKQGKIMTDSIVKTWSNSHEHDRY
jgi:hypothetical protein